MKENRKKIGYTPLWRKSEEAESYGRSMNALFTIFISGWDFRMLVISVLIVE